MKRSLIFALCFLQACAPGTTAAVAVASLGIAGAGLAAYCAAGGSGCSPALVAYGSLIVTEATKDATVLESGQSTGAELTQIVTNLNTDINSGKTLVGLTPQQQQEVGAIVAAAVNVVALINALIPPSSAPLASVKLPKLSANDSKKIASMRTSIAAANK